MYSKYHKNINFIIKLWTKTKSNDIFSKGLCQTLPFGTYPTRSPPRNTKFNTKEKLSKICWFWWVLGVVKVAHCKHNSINSTHSNKIRTKQWKEGGVVWQDFKLQNSARFEDKFWKKTLSNYRLWISVQCSKYTKTSLPSEKFSSKVLKYT